MTICAVCHKDRPGGAVNPATGDWECGGCNPAAASAQRRTAPRPTYGGRRR